MITGTAILTIITIIMIMMSAELGLLPCRRSDRGALRLRVWEKGWGEGGAGETKRAKGLTRLASRLQREQTEQLAYEPLP
jgi:hypothetical protein